MKFPFHLILEYAHTKPQEFSRALAEFFDDSIVPDEEEEKTLYPLFHEWILFDFRQKSGTSFINEYILKNPDNIPESDIDHFEQISKSHIFSHFAIISVQRGEWIEIEDVFTGQIYRIHDRTSSTTIPEKGLLHVRIGCVDKKWYFVGAYPLLFPTVYTQRMKKILRSDLSKVPRSPKDTANLLHQHSNFTSPPVLTKKEIKNKRKKLRKEFNKKVRRYNTKLNFNAVADAIYKENKVSVLDFWKQLANDGLGDEFIDKELQLLQDMWNYLPHEILGDKSPAELYAQSKQDNMKSTKKR